MAFNLLVIRGLRSFVSLSVALDVMIFDAVLDTVLGGTGVSAGLTWGFTSAAALLEALALCEDLEAGVAGVTGALVLGVAADAGLDAAADGLGAAAAAAAVAASLRPRGVRVGSTFLGEGAGFVFVFVTEGVGAFFFGVLCVEEARDAKGEDVEDVMGDLAAGDPNRLVSLKRKIL
jgi:hypothetical protein